MPVRVSSRAIHLLRVLVRLAFPVQVGPKGRVEGEATSYPMEPEVSTRIITAGRISRISGS